MKHVMELLQFFRVVLSYFCIRVEFIDFSPKEQP